MSLVVDESRHETDLLDIPDFSGPFLTGDEICRMQPEPSADTIQLFVGRDYLQGVDERFYKPTHHGRFIFNALLASPDGSVSFSELKDLGFAHGNTPGQRSATASHSGNTLVKQVNKLVQRSILEVEKQGYEKSIFLATCVEIVRIDDLGPHDEETAKKRQETRKDTANRVETMAGASKPAVVRPTASLEVRYSSSWRAMARCAGTDPEVFHGDDEESVDQAKSICAGCSVRPECLEHALVKREKFGVWGGLDERERRRVLRRRV